ncbi:MAG: M28 family metallopeptidase [Candidatus Marinimicrobia bacterium]|nr:M28 family metallopeptidase [Candidatus Neomarinimicrobiota bacterium]MDP6611627.1 M28 family metallopeptidase [Candidatus Neomarinimicrobiota bacterium]|tara:strand:+ start:4042 stop:5442 length:1401 start_codon:yes stop_codon:yes gene_type:complete
MQAFLISILTLIMGNTSVSNSLVVNHYTTKKSIAGKYKEDSRRIIEAALNDSAGFERLGELCDTFGPRFSGTDNLEKAIDWILGEMKSDGLDNVHGEKVMVPKWVRGEESVHMIAPWKKELAMLGLGGSIATPPGGIKAEVMVVGSFEELENRSSEARGKIVLFNVPFTNYGRTVQYRSKGAVAAAKAGAVASIIRSVGPYSMNTPHTGGMRYEEGVKKIPHAAITVEDAAMISRMVDRGQKVKIKLKMEAHFENDSPSRNVVGEIKGSEYPDQVIVMGGHIDSWDVGQGAMDDGGGCVAAWQAVKLMKDLGLRPKRTVRVVMWTNEENGLRGGNAYRDAHMNELDNHVLAIESDGGVFKPKGFGFSGSDEAFEMVTEIGKLLAPIEAGEITKGGGGADIGPIMREGVPGMGLRVEGSKYFWYHHTNADTWDKLDKDEFNMCVATLAVMAYVVADVDERLPRKADQ